jgi:hypothetical protein
MTDHDSPFHRLPLLFHSLRLVLTMLRREQAGAPERQTVALLEQLQRGVEV